MDTHWLNFDLFRVKPVVHLHEGMVNAWPPICDIRHTPLTLPRPSYRYWIRRTSDIWNKLATSQYVLFSESQL